MAPSLADAIATGVPLLLDGAVGTELAARGFTTDRPGWSVAATYEAPELLTQIYADYVAAGADIVTANTFRAHRAALHQAIGCSQRDMIAKSVELVRLAKPRFIVASVGPINDCYRPDLVPDDKTLLAEYTAFADAVAASEPDGVILETMNTFREAEIALQCFQKVGLTTIASLWAADGAVLGDGVGLASAIRNLHQSGAACVGVNCLPADEIDRVLSQFDPKSGPLVAYGNTGRPVADGWETTAAADPETYADLAISWVRSGAAVVGGCCMTTPVHIREVRKRLDRLAFAPANV